MVSNDLTLLQKSSSWNNEEEFKKLKYLFENAKVGIAMCRAEDNQLIMVNPAFAAIHGYSPEELIGATPGEVFAPECMIRLSELESSPSTCAMGDISFETVHFRKDGTTVPVAVHITVIKDENGVIKHRIATIQDITKQKRSEEHRQRTKAKLSSVISTIPDMIWVKDMHGNYLMCNPAFERFFGTSCDNIIGKTDYDFLSREQADFLRRKDHEALEAGEIQINEEEITFVTDGHRILLETRRIPVYNGDEFMGVLGIGRDITDKKESERLIHTLTLALNSSSESIFLVDIKNGCFVYVNDTACRLLGYDRAELTGGMSILDIDPDFSSELWEAHINELRMLGHVGIETRHRSKSGHTYPVEVIAHHFEYDGQEYNLAHTRDITEKKAYENTILTREREFRTLTENSPDVVIRYDLSGRRLYVNPMAEKLFGRSANGIVGTPFDVNSPLSDISTFKKLFKEVVSTGKAVEFEHEFVTPSGERGWGHNRIVPEFDSEGVLVSVMTIGRDITERKLHESQLREREREFRALAEYSPDTIARYDACCRRLYANPALIRSMGLPAEKLLDVTPTTYNHTPNAVAYEDAIREVIATGSPQEIELVWPDKNGQIIISQIRIVPEYDDNGKVHTALAVGRDITKLKEYEARLLNNEMRLKEAQSIARLGNWELIYPEMNLTWSEEVYRIFEFDPAEPPSYELFINCVHPDDRELVNSTYRNSVETRTSYNLIHRLLFPGGRIKYVHERGNTYYDEMGHPTYSVGTVQDITEHKSLEKKMEFQAHHDALTGLPNRMMAKKRAQQAISLANKTDTMVALLYIDLDGFKIINDTLGHGAGDSVLKIIAFRIQELIREYDIISRQGGDEFLLVLPHIQTIDDITAVAEKLLAEFEKMFEIGTHHLSISASIGISIYPNHGSNYDTLLQNADMAMYRAKETGKNGYCVYSQQINHDLIGQFKLQNDLKSALANNEFILYYQPQIDPYTHTITGAEALLRWKHPQMGMIPPMSFIPITENSGLIVPIGEWIIQEACRQIARWKEQGMDLSVAVNISSVQFKRGNLEEIVKHATHKAEIDPYYLELELTESVMMHDTEKTLQTVQSLKAFGIQLSIDDFGTGYSSLAYLKRFEVDKLKIDQSFVRDILSDNEDAVIVKTIIQMAKSLNLRTIAEGVENAQVLTLLQNFGCDEVQGYHYAKPMEAAQFEAFYRDFYAVIPNKGE